SPVFINEPYDIITVDPLSGKHLSKETFIPSLSNKSFSVNTLIDYTKKDSIESLSKRIKEHSESQTFDKEYLTYLEVLQNITGQDYTENKNLRGGYYELLFYKLLEEL